MLRAIFLALFRALADYARERRIDRDYQEALQENARRDAEARALAGQAATEKRINREKHKMASDDASAFRERLRARDPETR